MCEAIETTKQNLPEIQVIYVCLTYQKMKS